MISLMLLKTDNHCEAHKKWNIHNLHRLSNWTVWETISLDDCSEEWSD